MSERSRWVDYARGIGIILVVYGHVARGVHSAGLPVDPGWFSLADSVIYSFHMPLFFFLSGLYFLGSLQRHGANGFLAEKLRTVAWPYLVWSVIQGLVEVLLANATNGDVTLVEVASLLWQPRAQFWFLYALFFVMLVAVPAYRWAPVRWHSLLAVAACLAYLGAEYLPGGVPLTFLIQYGPYFALGVWFGRFVGVLRSSPPGTLLTGALLVLMVALQWTFHDALGMTYADRGYLGLLLAVTTVFAVVLLSIWLERFRIEWLALLGRASLAIYVMHILAGSGTRIIMQKYFGIYTAELHLVIGTLSGIVLPLLALKFIEAHRMGILLSWPGVGRSGVSA